MHKKLYWLYAFSTLSWLLAACAPVAALPVDLPPEEALLAQSPTPIVSALPDLGPAPELANDTWINVDQPLRMADLRGKVVLIDMWTFG